MLIRVIQPPPEGGGFLFQVKNIEKYMRK